MQKADTPDRARGEGIQIAREMLNAARPMIQGVQVSVPSGRYANAVEILEVVGGRALATFEESLKQLEGIVAQLERGDLPLEDSIKMFEEGMRLSAQCKQELDSAESKVQILLKQRDGSLKAEPFPLK